MRTASFVLTLLLAGVVHAGETPEQAVQEYLTAFNERGVAAVTGYIHPAELERFKGMAMPLFRSGSEAERQQAMEMFFGKDMTLETLEKLPAADFMAAFMNLVGKQIEGLKFSSFEVVGSIREGEQVHVVSRIKVDAGKGVQMTKMQVTSTKRFEKTWKLMLSGELEGIASALSAR